MSAPQLPPGRPRVFVTRPLPSDCMDRLEACTDVTLRTSKTPPSEDELLRLLPGHDLCVCMLTDVMNQAVLQLAAEHSEHPLRLVAQVAVGLDNIDLAAARRLGIAVTHTPGVLTEATADLCMALLLAVTRRVVEADRFLREGSWETWSLDLLTGLELRGATLGIIGMGRIGTAVARRARSFGMRIQYSGLRDADPELEQELEACRVNLPTLLASSDVVSVHAPLNETTEHLLDRKALFSMKPGTYLVNTSRGGLVEEAALAEALDSGPLQGVALDVYEDEPSPHPSLLERRDVVLLPHLGSATRATRHKMASMATDSVVEWAGGRQPANLVP